MKIDKQKNSVIVLLGAVKGASVVPCCVEFTVRCYNSVDMTRKDPQNSICEDIPGYLGRDELMDILSNLRSNIQVCWHGEGVSVVLKEEDSS
jgi:hypothetical protein